MSQLLDNYYQLDGRLHKWFHVSLKRLARIFDLYASCVSVNLGCNSLFFFEFSRPILLHLYFFFTCLSHLVEELESSSGFKNVLSLYHVLLKVFSCSGLLVCTKSKETVPQIDNTFSLLSYIYQYLYLKVCVFQISRTTIPSCDTSLIGSIRNPTTKF